MLNCIFGDIEKESNEEVSLFSMGEKGWNLIVWIVCIKFWRRNDGY